MIRKAFDNGEPYIHNTTVECNKQEQKSLLPPAGHCITVLRREKEGYYIILKPILL